MSIRVLVTGGSGFIGSILCQYLAEKYRVYNVDVRAPESEHPAGKWIQCSVLDRPKLMKVFQNVQPEYVYHLAAKADMFGRSIMDYEVNIRGTENVIDCAEGVGSVRHLVVCSSQLVVRPGYVSLSDDDFAPLDQFYALSKVRTEQLTRDRNHSFNWTIVRPTNIWGRFHPRFPKQIWRYINKGWYMHPSIDVKRSYGYVENVVSQLRNIIEVRSVLVSKKVFYLGDEPVFSCDWVNAFSNALVGHEVRRVPNSLLKCLAITGELLKKAGFAAPIYMERYQSMTSEYIVPMKKTFDILGEGPYSLEDGVERTVKLLSLTR